VLLAEEYDKFYQAIMEFIYARMCIAVVAANNRYTFLRFHKCLDYFSGTGVFEKTS